MAERLRRLFSSAVALVAALLVLPAVSHGAAPDSTAAPKAGPSYTNPVGDGGSVNFADPTVIRGRDGYWYAYATADPSFPGDYYRKMKIMRSDDLVSWEYVDDVFTDRKSVV